MARKLKYIEFRYAFHEMYNFIILLIIYNNTINSSRKKKCTYPQKNISNSRYIIMTARNMMYHIFTNQKVVQQVKKKNQLTYIIQFTPHFIASSIQNLKCNNLMFNPTLADLLFSKECNGQSTCCWIRLIISEYLFVFDV